MKWASAACFSIAVLASATARAQDAAGATPTMAPGAAPPATPRVRRYGWQSMLAYLAADATLAAGAGLWLSSPSYSNTGWGAQYYAGATLTAVGLAAHPLAGAAVHWMHRQWRKGGASIGVHLGSILGGAGFASAITGAIGGFGNCSRTCDISAMDVHLGIALPAGALAGWIAGMAVDAGYLAKEPADTAIAAPTWTVGPWLTQGTAGVAAQGMW